MKPDATLDEWIDFYSPQKMKDAVNYTAMELPIHRFLVELRGLRTEIKRDVAIYTVEDEGDHVYLTAFGAKLGRWQIDSPEAVAVLKLCTLLRLDDGEFAEQRQEDNSDIKDFLNAASRTTRPY
jgi:hypothetical protein